MNGAILGESLIRDPEEMYVALETIQQLRFKYISEVVDNKTKEEKLEELREIHPRLGMDMSDNRTTFIEFLVETYPDFPIALNLNKGLWYAHN